MNKFILPLFFIFASVSTGAQNLSKLPDEAQVLSLLCHQWNLTYIEGKGKKFNVPGNTPQLHLEFNKDGSLNESAGKKSFKGKWSYNHSTRTITTDDQDGKEAYTLVNISDAELVIRNKIKGIEVNLGLQRVN